MATTYYVSNGTDNAGSGWGVTGNDSNNGTAKATPYLTIAKACSVAAQGDSIIINPTATAYSENSGSGYLDIGAASLITGDPTLAGTAVAPSTVPTIRAASDLNRVVNVQTRAYAQTLACLLIDAQSSASRSGITPHAQTNGGLILQQINFRNIASGASVVQLPSAGSTLTFDRLSIDSSVLCTTTFNWGSTSLAALTVLGGVYSNNPSSAFIFYFNGQTVTTVTFAADVNGTLPLFNMAAGTLSSQVRFNNATVTTLNFSAQFNGCKGGIEVNTGTITNMNITRCVATNHTGQAAIRVIGVTTSAGQVNGNTGSGQQALIFVLSELAQGLVFGNSYTAITGTPAGIIPLNYCCGTGAGSHYSDGDNVMIQSGACTQAIQHGFNGWSADATNTAASTANQNLGDLSANTFVGQFWTTQALTSNLRCTHLEAFDVQLKKVLAPTATLTGYLYADNAGAPGALVATSTNTISAAALTTSFQTVHFTFTPTAISAATKYWAVIGTSTVDASNYVQINLNGTTTIGSITKAQTIGTWTADSTHCMYFVAYVGCAGCVPTIRNFTVTYQDTTDVREREGLNTGAMGGITIAGGQIINGDFGVVVKNVNAAHTANAINVTGIFSVTQSGTNSSAVYSKASYGVTAYQCTGIIAGTATSGSVYNCDADSIVTFNPVVSTNMTIRNCIAICNATSYAYKLGAASSTGFSTDYNCVYTANTQIEGVSGKTWAQWQAVPYDTHSINSNPLLLNQATPGSFIDIKPTVASPVVGAGTDVGAIDYRGKPFGPRPAMGAIAATVALGRRPRVRKLIA